MYFEYSNIEYLCMWVYTYVCVTVRELWEGLESGQKFTDWAKSRITANPYFEENVDYSLLPKL